MHVVGYVGSSILSTIIVLTLIVVEYIVASGRTGGATCAAGIDTALSPAGVAEPKGDVVSFVSFIDRPDVRALDDTYTEILDRCPPGRYARRMARGPRLDAPGALHHVMARGIERREMFEDDADRQAFLVRAEQALRHTGGAVYAWCLLPNHVHWGHG